MVYSWYVLTSHVTFSFIFSQGSEFRFSLPESKDRRNLFNKVTKRDHVIVTSLSLHSVFLSHGVWLV